MSSPESTTVPEPFCDDNSSRSPLAGARRNILIVIGSLDVGGTERHILRTVPRLASAERVFTVFTLARPGTLADELQSQGVRVITPWIETRSGRAARIMLAFRILARSLQLLLYLLAQRPDIVHCILPQSYWLAAPLAILAGIRGRMMSRRSLNIYLDHQPTVIRWLERWLHQRMSAIVGNSQAVVDQLIREEGAPADRTVLIYNGIDTAAFLPTRSSADMRRSLGVGDGTVVLCAVANLIPYKGHADLLAACARLDPTLDWHLLVVGNDTSGIAVELIRMARDFGIAKQVSFLGSRDDIADILHAADIGVLASHEEGLPNAILEYMAAGLPVVATAVGGVPELVIPHETGLLVPARDVVRLTDALGRLIADQGLRSRFGAAGQERVRKTFAIERTLEQYAQVYDRVASRS